MSAIMRVIRQRSRLWGLMKGGAVYILVPNGQLTGCMCMHMYSCVCVWCVYMCEESVCVWRGRGVNWLNVKWL